MEQTSDLAAGEPATNCGGADSAHRRLGLYRSKYERDSCGFGLIASLDDQAVTGWSKPRSVRSTV